MIPLLCAGLSCAARPPSDAEVVRAYRLFGWGRCDAIRSQVEKMDFSGEGAKREPFFRLLEAYCIELDGDTAAARSLYSAVVAKAPRTTQAFEAALRLRDLERLESQGLTRAQLKEQVEQRWESPLYEHSVKPIQRIDPKYPPAVVAARLEGWVTIDFEISSEGSVLDPVVIDSKPPFVFEGAALAAMRHWIYEPSDLPGPVRATVKLKFDIQYAAP